MVFIDHEPPCLISPPFRPDDDVFGEDDDAFGPDEDALDEVHDTFGGNCNIFGGLHSAVGEADDAFGELWDFFGQDDDPDLPQKLCNTQCVYCKTINSEYALPLFDASILQILI